MITEGSLVKIVDITGITRRHLARLDRPEEIEQATNSIINSGYSNVDYTTWGIDGQAKDTSKSPLSRWPVSTNSPGLVTGKILVKYSGVYQTVHEKMHWKVLIGRHIFLVPWDKVVAMKPNKEQPSVMVLGDSWF